MDNLIVKEIIFLLLNMVINIQNGKSDHNYILRDEIMEKLELL